VLVGAGSPLDFSRVFDGQGKKAAIIGVGGGKGGIGKTLLSANLGICLAKGGLHVVLVDADLGGANLHTCLGIDQPRASLSDFVQRRVERIEDTIVETGICRLGLISGAQDFLGSANIKYLQKMRMLKKLLDIDTDVVIMDLGSGTSYNMLDFFLTSDVGVVVMMPEPTSLENSYRFIKSAFYRLLRHREKEERYKRIIDESMISNNAYSIRSPYDLIRFVNKMDPERSQTYLSWLKGFNPTLVINQVRSKEDQVLGKAIRAACFKYFGIDLDYLGHLEYDDIVWQTIRQRNALLQMEMDSKIVSSFWRLAEQVVRRLAMLESPGSWKIG
jgi:flagellar biosynthesis protein FlhG